MAIDHKMGVMRRVFATAEMPVPGTGTWPQPQYFEIELRAYRTTNCKVRFRWQAVGCGRAGLAATYTTPLQAYDWALSKQFHFGGIRNVTPTEYLNVALPKRNRGGRRKTRGVQNYVQP